MILFATFYYFLLRVLYTLIQLAIYMRNDNPPYFEVICYNNLMNIRSYLPSKKIQIALISIMVLCLGYGVYHYVSRNSSIAEESNLIDVAFVDGRELNKEYYKDTDGDGAYDWEENLWFELDPNNPDSDGDGVLDGKYLQNKRSIAERERRGTDLPESNLTPTEKLARSTITALLAITQTGATLEDDTQVKFQSNVVNYISDLTLGDILYTREQLLLVADTKENTYAYRERMKALFKKYPIAASDLEILINSVENPKENLSNINIKAEKYNNYLSELRDTEVPYVIAGRHTELINNVSQINAAFKNLSQEEVDELVSLSFVVQLEKILNQITDAVLNINLFFDIIEDKKLFPFEE